MGKLALIALAVFTAAGAYISLARHGGIMDGSERVADKQYEVLARNAALAGFSRARQALADDYASAYFSGNDGTADYDVTADVTVHRAVVQSVATITGARDTEIEYTVRGDFNRIYGAPPAAVPGFMDFALISDQDMVLRGDVSGIIDVEGDEASELNANLHTNGSLDVTGNSARIQGFGTYAGAASGNLDDTFEPNYNPAELPSAYQSDVVDIPEADFETWTDNATPDRTTAGSLTLGGEYSEGGTRDMPFVWHVQGDLTVATDAVVNGYTMFIVEGDVYFDADLTVGDSGHDGPLESSLGIYSGGGMELGGNIIIDAQLFAGGDVSFKQGSGTPTLRGSLTSKGVIDFRGTPDIYFRPPSPALIFNWIPRDNLVSMGSYYER